jgi:hypothetical protein
MVTDPAKPRCILLKRRAILNRIVLSIPLTKDTASRDDSSSGGSTAPQV